MLIRKIMRQNVAINLMVKKLSIIFYCIFKVFMFLNMGLLGLSLYVMLVSRSNIGTFLFVIFFINFWIMMVFFCLLSMCIKLFICMVHEDLLNTLDDGYSWMSAVIFFPLISEEDEQDFVQMISLQSLQEDQEQNTQPPTTEHLSGLESKWKTVWKEIKVPDEKKEEQCLICSNPYTHEFPYHKGCIELTCSCATLFHKKCVLEWFHFNERQDQTDETKTVVSCPSCRHVFVV